MSSETVHLPTGGVSGPVGHVPGGDGNTIGDPTSKVWGYFGHSVNGSQCPLASDSKLQVNDLALLYTRPSGNYTVYTVEADVDMTDKQMSRRSVVLYNCPYGPPTWGPTATVSSSQPRFTFPGTSNPDKGDTPPTFGGSGSFNPLPLAHTGAYSTDADGDSSGTSSENTDVPGGIPNNQQSTSPPPTTYDDETSASSDDTDWASPSPPGGVPKPDPHAGERGDSLSVRCSVQSQLTGSAQEISVAWDWAKAKVTLTATITP